jgi:hypothetical protein
MSEIEDRARQMGWVPQDDFRGDPDNCRPAEEFVERGENIMPILKERLGKMEENLKDVTGRLEKKTESLEKFAEFHKGTYQRAYEKAFKDLEARKLQAVEDGDTAAYQEAQQAEHELAKEQAELESPMGGEGQDVVPEFHDFKKANAWYDQDVAMTVFVNHIAPGIAQTVANDVEFFQRLEQEARREFPHKFTGQTGSNAVESPDGSVDTEVGSGKGWRDVPKEAQDAFNLNFADIEGFTKEQYAKDYFAQE